MSLQFPHFNFFSLGFMNTRLQEKSSYVGGGYHLHNI